MTLLEKYLIAGLCFMIVAWMFCEQQNTVLEHKIDIYKLTCVQVDISRSSELTNAIVLQFKKP